MVNVELVLRVEYDDAEDLLADYAEQLARGSIAIAHRRALEVDTPVVLALSFPGLVAPIQVAGIVREVRPGAEAVMAIEIADAAAREHLASSIARILRRDPAMVHHRLRALVVEDNPHIAALICAALSSDRHGLGITCVAATDGQSALERVRSQHFDALIVDLYLPILDGVGLITAVRRELGHRAPPIIVLSAAGPEAHRAALAAGADTFLEKPVRLRPLLDAMRLLVEPEVPDVHPRH